MNNLPYLVALHSIDGLGPVRLKKVIEYFEDPKTAWDAGSKEFLSLGIPRNVVSLFLEKRNTLNPEKYFQQISDSGIKIVSVFDKTYPKNLLQIYDPPTILYYKGSLDSINNRAIGVVGTRKITGYGKTVTEKFATELSQAGFVIVSGLARGVDTVSHWAAINAKGQTIACLGGGLNKIFPPENFNLSQKIADGFGAVITEYPPDYPSLAGNFPARNRIIAGLSLAVLVTEAAEDSGSLITANLAIENGKDVFAIPGPITSSLSQGPASLIKNGAKLVTSVEDILNELGLEKVKNDDLKNNSNLNLSDLEKIILELLVEESKHIDELVRQLKKPSFEISSALVKMEILGIVKNLGSGIYAKSL